MAGTVSIRLCAAYCKRSNRPMEMPPRPPAGAVPNRIDPVAPTENVSQFFSEKGNWKLCSVTCAVCNSGPKSESHSTGMLAMRYPGPSGVNRRVRWARSNRFIFPKAFSSSVITIRFPWVVTVPIDFPVACKSCAMVMWKGGRTPHISAAPSNFAILIVSKISENRLRIHSRCQESAVHRDSLAGDVASRIGSQQHRGADQFLWFSETLHGSAHQKLAAAICAVQQSGIQIRPKYARRDGVHIDPHPGPLYS